MKPRPTKHLRFVERQIRLSPFYKSVNGKGEVVPATQAVRILQQFWEEEDGPDSAGGTIGAWRDIPVVAEGGEQ